MDFGFPVLSALIFIPVIAGVLILFIPSASRDIVRGVAITAAVVTLALSGLVFFSYQNAVATGALAEPVAVTTPDGVKLEATAAFERGLFYQENVPWVQSLGISYTLGVDGLSAPMVLLTGMVAVAGVLISWQISDRQREFYSFFMLLVAGVMGVFISVDMFLLFFFYELAIFPMYILIAGWGWVKLREYAAMKLTLYILIGSVVALVGAIAMVFTAAQFFTDNPAVLAAAIEAGLLPSSAQPASFNLVQLTLAAENGAFAVPFLGNFSFSVFWFPFMFIGFGVMAGLFPFHNWSPDGHVAAPTAVSMIHAGVLMKLGAFAALRTAVQMLPEGALVHLPWIVFLATVNVVYGALIAFRQRDFKYVIGFSSVSHMGLVSMGWATMNAVGMTGAGLQMFSHGAMTALFFGCVGMVYDRAHTRDIPSLGGFMKVLPWTGVFFIIGGLTSMGMPGFSGFIAEFPIFQGMWNASESVALAIGPFTLSNYYSILVIISALGIVITAAYVLRVSSQVFFGEYNQERYGNLPAITVPERVVLLLLGVPLIVLGLYPPIMAPMITEGIKPVLLLLGVN